MERADIVIVGGGLAGAVTVEHYRKAGGTGTVILISQEAELPVHRPPLSKEYLRGEAERDTVFVHPAGFYVENHIAVRLERRVDEIDLSRKRLTLHMGEAIGFEKLVLATGARPRPLTVPGANLPGVLYLRSLEDADHLRTAYEGAERAVIIGAGFIGMEVAAALTERGVRCTVVEMMSGMWPRLVPQVVADFIQRYYEDRGVGFRFGQATSALLGDTQVTSVLLENGEVLPADLVVAGVGVLLNTDLAERAGLAVDRGIVVDEFLRTSHPDVYAVGDVASFPDPIGGRLHLEHWDNAVHQGRTLGQTLAGRPAALDHVAYFFSDLFDLSLNMVGYPVGWDEIVVRGEPKDGRFTAIYGRKGAIRAALMINDDEYFDVWTKLVQSGASLDARLLADAAADPGSLIVAGA